MIMFLLIYGMVKVVFSRGLAGNAAAFFKLHSESKDRGSSPWLDKVEWHIVWGAARGFKYPRKNSPVANKGTLLYFLL